MRAAPLALLAGVALAAAGCGGDGEKSGRQTTTLVRTVTAATTTSGTKTYPPVIVNNFMRSCTSGMKNRRSYCACTLDELSATVSVRDFVRIGLAGGKLPPRIRSEIERAAAACADKLPG